MITKPRCAHVHLSKILPLKGCHLYFLQATCLTSPFEKIHGHLAITKTCRSQAYKHTSEQHFVNNKAKKYINLLNCFTLFAAVVHGGFWCKKRINTKILLIIAALSLVFEFGNEVIYIKDVRLYSAIKKSE